MRTFEVTQRDARGQAHGTCRVVADDASDAVAWVRATVPAQGDTTVYAVYRHRRLRGRRFVGLWSGPGYDGGPAGVREPRRPRPTPPSLSVQLEVPREGF
jgi:hypothetical protein